MNYKIELISGPELQCGEGLVWDSINNCLYWTNSLGKAIYFYKKEQTYIYHQGLHAASLTLHKNGGFLTCGKDGFALLTKGKEICRYNDIADGITAHYLNDIIADPKGRVFAGQECFQESVPYQTGYLFRLDVDGSLHIVDEGFHIANGMGFSPNSKTFYAADTILRNIYQYDYNVETGSLSNRKMFIRFNKDEGLPDGLTVDADGCLWVAMFLGSQIICIDSDGLIKERIELPFAQPTSVTLGGKDLNELYITSAALHWQTNLAPERHNFGSPRGGALYRIKTDTHGKSDFQACTSVIF